MPVLALVTVRLMTAQVFAILLLLAVLWGSAFPGIKMALEGLQAGHLTLLRHLIASLCYIPYLLIFKGRLLPDRRDLPYFFLLGALGTAIYHSALNFGQTQVSAGAASLIIATAPAITAVLATLMLGDRLPLLGWFGIAISLAGVLLIVLGEGSGLEVNPFALLVLLSAVVTSFNTVLQKRILQRYQAVEVIAFSTWAGSLLLLVFLPGFFADVTTAPAGSLLATLYIGMVPSAIANALFTLAISKAPVTVVSSFLYTVPVFSLLFSWLLVAEVPTSLTLLGGAVAICGVIVVNRAKRRAARLAAIKV